MRYVRIPLLGLTISLTTLLGACSDPPEHALPLAAQGIYTGAISNDGTFALIGSMNHGASLWQTGPGERLYNWNHESGGFTDLVATAFSADGSKAVTGAPRSLVVWDTQTGRDLAFWGTPAGVLDLDISNDASRLLMGLEDHSALLIDPRSGAHLRTLLHKGVVGAVALSADAGLAITGSDDESAVVWNLATGARLATLKHSNPVRTVALSPDGQFAFTAAQGREVTLWRTDDGSVWQELSPRNSGVMSAAFSADGERLLVGYVNRTVELWSVRDGARLQRWKLPNRRAHGGAILAVGFAEQAGLYLALRGDGTLLQLRRT